MFLEKELSQWADVITLDELLQPRFVVNRVTAGDYDCPRKILSFLTGLHASFRMLNLRNDFLRKKFDGEFNVPCSGFPLYIAWSIMFLCLHVLLCGVMLCNTFPCRFPGMKYDLRRVEEVYYDVKIRGLASAESKQEVS
jgi:hypothetical protein